MFANLYRIGQRVALSKRPEEIRAVAAIQRVQQYFFYELSGLHDFLIREDALIAQESHDAQGYVPCPFSQVTK